MKNKNFYNVVNKTKLIDVFKKNKVMMNTYFGQLPATGLSLDFTKQDTFNELVNASPWVASEPHTDFTLYRRADNFTQVLSHEPDGTILSTTGTAKTDRYGLTMTGSSKLGDKFFYFIKYELNWTKQPVESTNRILLSWFMGDNPTAGDHTRITLNALNGNSKLKLETITTEGSTSRTVVYESPFFIRSGELIIRWDRTNHTIELVIDSKSRGTFPYYGGSLGYASIAGTGQAAYKPETSLLIRDIEIGQVK